MKTKKGFTFFELLGVIAILGVIIAITSVGVMKIIRKSENKNEKVSVQFLHKAATYYAMDFVKDDDWSGKIDVSNNTIKNEFYCVSVGSLKEKKYINLSNDKNLIDPDTNEIYTNDTLIKVERDYITKNFIDTTKIEKCDCPSIKLNISGTNVNGWYKDAVMDYEVILGNIISSENPTINYKLNGVENSSLLQIDRINKKININTSGKNMQVCVYAVSNNVVGSMKCINGINIDKDIPNKPLVIPATNQVNMTGSFKGDIGVLNISNSNNTVSDITYYYTLKDNNKWISLDTLASSATLSVDKDNFDNKTILVKACNEVNVCSESTSFDIKFQKKDTIIDIPFYPGTGGGFDYPIIDTCDSTCQMQKNSEKWGDPNMSKEDKDKLHENNVIISKTNPDCNGNCNYNPYTGVWTDNQGNLLYNVSNNQSNNSINSSGLDNTGNVDLSGLDSIGDIDLSGL
ncbi:MAG: type II secretion system protein, partial [Bacilli bacterium]